MDVNPCSKTRPPQIGRSLWRKGCDRYVKALSRIIPVLAGEMNKSAPSFVKSSFSNPKSLQNIKISSSKSNFKP